jgi:hypothetical protein
MEFPQNQQLCARIDIIGQTQSYTYGIAALATHEPRTTVYYIGLNAEAHMETNNKVERLLTDIRVKADQLIVDDEEARRASVSYGSSSGPIGWAGAAGFEVVD